MNKEVIKETNDMFKNVVLPSILFFASVVGVAILYAHVHWLFILLVIPMFWIMVYKINSFAFEKENAQ